MGTMRIGQTNVGTHERSVLVTGGAGFLGRRAVRRLLRAGHAVSVLDDGSGGTGERIDHLETHSRVGVYRVDLRDRDAVIAVCARERPWAVAHLAGRHFIPACQTHPEETWHVNVEGTRNLLDALTACQPQHLLFASTADVYRASTVPHQENDPVGSSTVYGQSKLATERLLRQTTSPWNTRVVIARLFNLYGPHPTVPHLIPTVVAQAAASDRLRLGDLTTYRDFVYVHDAASAVIEMLTRGPGGTYNIGTGTGTTGKDIVELVARLLGHDLSTTLDPERLRPSSRPALIADPTKLHGLLPWWPSTSLNEGLQHVIKTHHPRPPDQRSPMTATET